MVGDGGRPPEVMAEGGFRKEVVTGERRWRRWPEVGVVGAGDELLMVIREGARRMKEWEEKIKINNRNHLFHGYKNFVNCLQVLNMKIDTKQVFVYSFQNFVNINRKLIP